MVSRYDAQNWGQTAQPWFHQSGESYLSQSEKSFGGLFVQNTRGFHESFTESLLSGRPATKPRSVDCWTHSIYEIWRPLCSWEPSMLSILVALPGICASTQYSPVMISAASAVLLSLWCGSPTVGISLNRCVSFSIMSNQLDLPQLHHGPWRRSHLMIKTNETPERNLSKRIFLSMWCFSFCFCEIFFYKILSFWGTVCSLRW